MNDTKKITPVAYIRVPTIEGTIEKFPVSRHVLSLPRLKKIDLWKPSLVQQVSALVLVVSLFASSYGVTYGQLQATLAYFRDDETSSNNILQAGALDFTVSPDGDVSAIVEAGEHLVIPIMTPEPGTFPTMYRIVTEEFDGPNTMCTLLDADATTTPFTYTGDLLALTVTATTTSGAWPLEISLPSVLGLVEGDECVVDLVYRGWHKDVPENTGYTDEEKVRITLTYTASTDDFNIVLNEFLPNPDDEANGLDFGSDSANMPLGEWVELYNNGNASIDIADWYLADESGGAGNTQAVVGLTNTQPATTTIPAHGWLVIYFNKPVLNNTGDSIFLYTDTDVLVDSYTYDNPSDFCENEPTPTSTNASSSPSIGSCPGTAVAPNKSYARIPDGTGAFVDPVPTPGSPNIPDPEPELTAAESSGEPMPEVLGAETPQEEATTTPETEEETEGADVPEEVGNWSSSGGGGGAPAPVSDATQEPEAAPEDTGGAQENTEGESSDDAASSIDEAPLPEQPADGTPPSDTPEDVPDDTGTSSSEPSTEPPAPVDTPPPPPEPEVPPPPPPSDVPVSE
ncbi:lamin tail domain-containing protein [Candidatus Kaiserbacteria bacterium]|nr:lamin tail domain-containing protein [Candidatus Kaiserbacteria bacterium]